jgi:hypothetical protein
VTLTYLERVLGRHTYCSSELMPSGYRLSIGFDTPEQVEAAGEAIGILRNAFVARSASDTAVKHGGEPGSTADGEVNET